MSLSTHDFRSHISRSSRSVTRIICLLFSSYPQISHPNIPITIQNKVLRLNIPMYNLIIMQVFQPQKDTCHKKPCLFLIKPPLPTYMIPQVSSTQIIHHQIKIIPILKSLAHINQKRVLKLRQQNPFIHDRINTLFSNNKWFRHFLHSVQFPILLTLNLPDLPKPSLPDHIAKHKRLLINLHSTRHVLILIWHLKVYDRLFLGTLGIILKFDFGRYVFQ